MICSIIGDSSFSNCNNLETIELPHQLKEISSHSFEGCKKLKSITILSDISKILWVVQILNVFYIMELVTKKFMIVNFQDVKNYHL